MTRGELTQQEPSAELCIDKSNVARLCARMIDEGHAVQATGAEDRRHRVVSLTAAGKRLARDVNIASRERFAALLSGLKATQREQIIHGLNQLVAAIDASEFHRTADRIGTAARERDGTAVMIALGSTLQACTSCHAVWKQQVVDEPTWQRLASSSGPAERRSQ